MKNIHKYLITLIALLLAASTSNTYFPLSISQPWPRHIIDNTSSGADGVKLADFNGDGLFDITTGWEEGGITKLYIHPTSDKDLKLPWPSVKIGDAPDVEDAVFVDINRDEILDIVSCTEGRTQKIFVHLAPKKDSLNPENWVTKALPVSEGIMQWMYAEPLQLDGKNGVDLIAAGKGEKGAIGWFEAPKEAENLHDWKWHKISDMGWVMSLMLKDMDQDGDMDIVVTDRRKELRGCRWLENPGILEKQRQPWQNHFIGGQDAEVMFMTMADIDGDGVDEAVVSERTSQTLRVFKQIDQKGHEWEERIVYLPTIIGQAKSVEVGDLDDDGVKDFVISTNTYGPSKHGLIWIKGNVLQKKDMNLEFQTISGIHNAKYDKVELLDIDHDGDLDVLICEENDGENSEGLGVIWYENTIEDK